VLIGTSKFSNNLPNYLNVNSIEKNDNIELIKVMNCNNYILERKKVKSLENFQNNDYKDFVISNSLGLKGSII